MKLSFNLNYYYIQLLPTLAACVYFEIEFFHRNVQSRKYTINGINYLQEGSTHPSNAMSSCHAGQATTTATDSTSELSAPKCKRDHKIRRETH